MKRNDFMATLLNLHCALKPETDRVAELINGVAFRGFAALIILQDL